MRCTRILPPEYFGMFRCVCAPYLLQRVLDTLLLVLIYCTQYTVVRPGGLTVDAPTGVINVIKGEVS